MRNLTIFVVLLLAMPAYAQHSCPHCGGQAVAMAPARGMVQNFANGALAAANRKRSARGLPPFQYNPALQASVDMKARIQANRGGPSFHPGGGFGPGAVGEGTGRTSSPENFLTCFLYSNYTHAAAATARSRNGQYYHALQVSGSGSSENVTQRPRMVQQPFQNVFRNATNRNRTRLFKFLRR